MKKTKIEFGTDGFRGIIAKDFTFETLERIIKAICLYLKDEQKTAEQKACAPTENTVIIGYDPRFMAKDFAKFSAELFKTYGFDVILSSKVVPTPVVAYCSKYYSDSIGAIMLTASHNPKEYQGIKFIPNYAGPATKEITDKILSYLDKDIKPADCGKIIEKDLENLNSALDSNDKENQACDYFSHIEKIIDFETIKKNQPKIIYDGLFSSSIGYFDKLLDKHNIKYESYNMFHSSDFGGGLPEPKEKFMKHKKEGFITIANDGDADRYGVIDEKGNWISPNIILAVLLKYLASKELSKVSTNDKIINPDSNRAPKGKMIKTVGVSALLDVVAEKLNIETITTPVGFKWLGEAMRKNETILAGEDSGGLSTGNHISEKDGILANLLIIEMLAKENKTLNQLVQEIKEFANCEFFTDRVDIKLEDDISSTKDDKVKKIQEKFDNFDKIADFKINSKLKIDGIKLFLDNNLSTLLIRKSGTEALLRFYIESENLEKLDKIKKFVIKNAK